jgi:hypothetical protein
MFKLKFESCSAELQILCESAPGASAPIQNLYSTVVQNADSEFVHIVASSMDSRFNSNISENAT